MKKGQKVKNLYNQIFEVKSCNGNDVYVYGKQESTHITKLFKV